jgi:transposase
MKLPSTIEECHALINQLLATISLLQAEVEELKRQLNQNSRNSHRPPSSEGYKKKPAIPRKKHKKGGQPGHQGNTLKMVENPDEIIELKPEVCQECQRKFDGKRTGYTMVSRRQKLDIPPMTLQSTEYQSYGCTCEHCGAYNQGAYPEGVNAPIQYGSGVKALVTLLHQNGCLSVEKIQTLFSDLFSAPLNEATILQCQHTAHDKLEEEEQYIKEQLSAGKVNHADESGVRVEGKNHWLHTLGNERYTYQFVHQKRGYDAHEPHLSVLHQYRGWLIHDFCSFYFRFTKAKHGACNAHVLRELQAQEEAGRSWAKKFRKYLLSIYGKTDQGAEKLSKKEQEKALKKYRQLLKAGYEEEPPPQPQPNGRGRPKNTKGRNLLLRLDEKREAILAFAWHKCVPFTNNLAERDIRPAKTKLKVAGCFRTLKGAQVYARINGFISTLRKQKLNPFNELVGIFNGNLPSYRLATT